MNRQTSIYHGRHFPGEIIAQAVYLYHRFTLSLRDVEELLAMRGISVSYETISVWYAPTNRRLFSRIRVIENGRDRCRMREVCAYVLPSLQADDPEQGPSILVRTCTGTEAKCTVAARLLPAARSGLLDVQPLVPTDTRGKHSARAV